MGSDPSFRDNEQEGRFELLLENAVVGWVEYRPAGDSVILSHTEIDEALEGQGLGGRLASWVLATLRERGRTIIPLCPFIAAYIERHPEQADIVDPRYRVRRDGT